MSQTPQGGFKRWFHQWGVPPIFVGRMDAMMPWLFGAGGIGLAVAWVWGLLFVPADYQQGDSFRIIYLHVPAAMIGMSAYATMAITAFVALVWKIKVCFSVIDGLAPIGFVFTVICLVTGSLWGRPTWGTYWEWDARLTSMLVLAFLYVGVMALRSAVNDQSKGDQLCAALSLVGAINLPIIKYSVEWWATLHQGSTLKLVGESSMDSSMIGPLLLGIVAGYCWFGAMACWLSKWAVIARNRQGRWLSEYWGT